jgi:UDP-N-acetyl-alpha-D-muramoyl-L-alanyl-L-glutamate epimerase
MFHFALLALAALTGARYGVFANERSADEGNFEWRGITVNHQYSKSAEFERDFGEYVSREITGKIEIFSLLRGIGELSIVERFAALPEYHDVFSSCNRNFHIAGSRLAASDRWCGICPKCAFVFLMLSAYLPSAEVVHIF